MLVLVISCKKHQQIWSKILDRNVPDLYIVCGGFEETRLNGNIIELNCNDFYEGLPEKVVLAYEFIYKNIPFSHILKVDDHDTDFTAKQIMNIQVKFKKILDTKDYIGQSLINRVVRKWHFKKTSSTSHWKTQEYSGDYKPYLGGGQTYILSKKAIQCIISKYNESTLDILRTSEIYEDLMIGKILFDNGIHPHKLNYGIKTWVG